MVGRIDAVIDAHERGEVLFVTVAAFIRGRGSAPETIGELDVGEPQGQSLELPEIAGLV